MSSRRLFDRSGVARLALLASVVFLVARADAAHAFDFVVVDGDGAGEGLNDTTAAAPVGGNPRTTRGAQRLFVIQSALAQWSGLLGGSIDLRVYTTFDPLPCVSNGAVLGIGGSTTVFINFPGAPRSNTWYPAPLANELASSDLAPGADEMTITLNSSLNGSAGCLAGSRFYLGIDGNAPAGTVDLYTVVLHEAAHALGFTTGVDLDNGQKLGGFDDAFMIHLLDGSTGRTWSEMTNAQRLASSIDTNDLFWNGSTVVAAGAHLTVGKSATTGNVEMYAPNPAEQGSSVVHFADRLSPDELMEPVLDGPSHNVAMTAALLRDIGWPFSACGDGHLDDGEACDDGNNVDGDCCSGSCFREVAGSPCGDATDTTCNPRDACDGAGTCLSSFASAGTRCGDATNTTCNHRDTCDGAGACLPNLVSAGTSCGDATNTTCNHRDTCDGAGACLPNLAAAGTPCGDATNTTCNARDTCDGAGACAQNLAAAGTPCGDPSSGVCDDPDACDGAGACAQNLRPANTICRAASGPCDATEYCDGLTSVCPADLVKPEGASCADARACNGSETCQAGRCRAGTPITCPGSGDVCTANVCTEPGVCTETPIAGCCMSADACDDGEACTADDCPVAGGQCTHAAVAGCCHQASDCDDGDLCTVDSCAPGSLVGACGHVRKTGCCMRDEDCDDGASCTEDSCDVAAHRCRATPIPSCCTSEAQCSDRSVCTTDSCEVSTGLCARAAIAGCCETDVDCDDGDACTADTCGADLRCTRAPIPGCVAPDAGVVDAAPAEDAALDDASLAADGAVDASLAADGGAVDASLPADGGLGDAGKSSKTSEPPGASAQGCACSVRGAAREPSGADLAGLALLLLLLRSRLGGASRVCRASPSSGSGRASARGRRAR